MLSKLLGNNKQGDLFILSAPAGTGKTTLADMLKKEFTSVLTSISFTTRKPREGEVDGVDYNFISREEFLRKIEEGEFLEHVELYGDFYGTSKKWVEEIKATLGAGAWKIIAEGRESGQAGLYRDSSEIRTGLIDEIIDDIEITDLIFEAPQKAQQAWFINNFGTDVNLGNIAFNSII